MNILQNRDILYLIFGFLRSEDLCNVAKTCRKWNSVYKNNKFVYHFGCERFVNEKLHLITNIDVNKTVKIYSEISDEGMINLYKNNKIKKLYLSSNFGFRNLSDKIVEKLSETLEILDMIYTINATNKSLQHLAKHKKIQILSISGENISDDGFVGLNFIEELQVNGRKITNSFLQHVSSDKLKRLYLPSQITSFSDIHFCKLTDLSLYASQISDDELKYIQTHHLKTLILSCCQNITDEGIVKLTKGENLHLDKLCLRSTKITNNALIYISATDLDIWGTVITDDGFLYLNKTFKLSMGEMNNITEKCLQYLSHVKNLLLPRTSIERKYLVEFQQKNLHIKCNPNFLVN